VGIAQSLDDGKIVEALEFRPWLSGAFESRTRSIQIKYLELMRKILEPSNK
jgi:hypothetical protein